MRISILGPPGSGKGTIAQKLAKEFNLFYVYPGEILREEVTKNTTLGREIKKYINKGTLVPEQFVTELVKLESRGKKKIIIDGFPRSLDQAKRIKEIGVDLVLYLNVSEEQVLKRLTGRRVCEKGIHNYHIVFNPPKIAGMCDIDKTKLTRRKDDNPSVIKDRFKIFHRETEPVISYFRRKKLLYEIDASPKPEIVYQNTEKILKRVRKK